MNTYAVDTNPLPGSTFFVPLRQTVKFYCICQYVTKCNAANIIILLSLTTFRAYVMVQILHNDSVIHPWQSCSTVLHTVHNVSYSDEGRYTCRVQDASYHICDRPLGNLSVISKCVIYLYAKIMYDTVVCNSGSLVSQFSLL